MTGAKESFATPILLAGAAVALSACSASDLKRFAPPGIVKYEEIAAEAPPNPTIQSEIDRRRDEGDAAFPVLSEMPSEADRPERRASADIDAQTKELKTAGGELTDSAASDRASIEEFNLEREALERDRDELMEAVENDQADLDAEKADENEK